MNQLALSLDQHRVWPCDASRAAHVRTDLAWSGRTDSQESQVVMRLLDAFSDIGGVVNGDALASLLRGGTEQPISLLARWIVQREVISFSWHSQTLLPLFQFDLETLQVRPGVPEVIAELREAFDDVELADWFARPNSWLQGSTPANRFGSDLPAVLQAARADRYVALGN